MWVNTMKSLILFFILIRSKCFPYLFGLLLFLFYVFCALDPFLLYLKDTYMSKVFISFLRKKNNLILALQVIPLQAIKPLLSDTQCMMMSVLFYNRVNLKQLLRI